MGEFVHFHSDHAATPIIGGKEREWEGESMDLDVSRNIPYCVCFGVAAVAVAVLPLKAALCLNAESAKYFAAAARSSSPS